MTEKIEVISKQRRAGLIALGFSFITLQILNPTFSSEGLDFWIGYLLNATLVLFAYVGLSMVFQRGRYESKNIENALEDELVDSNRNTALKYGFYAVIIVSAFLSLITPFWRLSGEFAARAILTVGVVTPMFLFSYLERDDA